MKNQVEALRGYGVKVHVLSSETTFPERQEVSARFLESMELKLTVDKP